MHTSTSNDDDIITINVGGQIFKTTKTTLAAAGPTSPLSSLSANSTQFFDRDPKKFEAILAALRSGTNQNKDSGTVSGDLDDLIDEAEFFGVDPVALLPDRRSPFDPFALRRSLTLPIPGRAAASAIAADHRLRRLLVAHGGKISSFDPFLRRRDVVITPLPAIDSLLAVPSQTLTLAAAGATDFAGIHLVDLGRRGGVLREVLHWSPHPSISSLSAATVAAINTSRDFLFGSFEATLRNASTILAFDLVEFRPVVEIARSEIFGAELDSAIPATKLQWLESFNLLVAAGSHGGPSGIQGNVRLWDVRSGSAVSVIDEKFDCFADITASDGLSAIFKIGINTGSVYTADIRKLSSENPWVCIGDARRTGVGSGVGKKEGSGCKIASHGSHVFCSRGGDIEIWTEVVMNLRDNVRNQGTLEEKVMKMNLMGESKDLRGNKITHLGFVGNKMVVARKDEHCVEVWENSSSVQWRS